MTWNMRGRGWSALAAPVLGALVAGALSCNDDSTLRTVLPDMVLEPDPGTLIEFEEVVLGRTQAEPRFIRIANEGEASLSIRDIRLEGASADQFRISSFPQALAANKEGEIFIRFEPNTPAQHEATLIIETDDPERPSVSYPVLGPAREPCLIDAGPPHQTFLLGEVREVEIRATSTHQCEITRLFLDRDLFEIIDDPELPVVIPAGQSLVLEVRHIGITDQPGIPIRELRIKESEGTEDVVTFGGEPPVYGCFSVFPPRIIFPQTSVGQQVTRSVRVTNECSREAAVTSVATSIGFYYFDVDRDAYPQFVPPQGSIDVEVTYYPFSPAGDLGRLNINTNDAANPRFQVELFGTAAVPQIRAFPLSLDFGTVIFKNPQGQVMRSECSSRSQFAQIFSTGDAPLIVDRMEIDQTGDELFLISSVVIGGNPVVDFNQPLEIPPDTEMRVTMQFFPTREMPSEHRSKLVIHHNASPDPEEITLIGNGANDGATTDIFTQLEGPKLDILWVIDNSCSMYDEQARLIANLSQFVGYADSQNASYQMAVTVTDSRSPSAGRLERCFPHPSVISNEYADTATREEAFECIFDVGIGFAGAFEAGLGAAMRTLERAIDPNDQDPNMNPNVRLLREDAKLAIVVMSDEDDQSAESDVVLRDFFFSVKGSHRPDRVSVHSIAGPVAEECETGPRQSQPGFRYSWMTQQTGGIFFNICREDWQPVLQDLGLSVFAPVDEWDLTQAADPSSLVVTVDGVPAPRDPVNGYVYNPVGNSIKFGQNAIPSPGAQIVVDYTGICRP